MIEKNLFANDRKPPPPESADASPKPARPAMALANIQLDGVIIQSNSKKAVLRMKSQPGGAAGQERGACVTFRHSSRGPDSQRLPRVEDRVQEHFAGKGWRDVQDQSYRCKQSGYVHQRLPPTRSCRAPAWQLRRRKAPFSLQAFSLRAFSLSPRIISKTSRNNFRAWRREAPVTPMLPAIPLRIETSRIMPPEQGINNPNQPAET